MTQGKFIPHLIGTVIVALLALGANGDGPLAAQQSRSTLASPEAGVISPAEFTVKSANPAEHPPPAAASVETPAAIKKISGAPLAQLGETLEYRVAWSTFSDAATVRTEVAAQGSFFGGDGLHLRAETHTQKPVRTLFAVDDQFDSYADAATLESRQYEMYLRELGRDSDAKFRLAPQGRATADRGPVVVVPPGTRDPLSAFFWLRSVDWDRTPEVRSPVYDGRNIYELQGRRSGAGKITTAAGTFQATKIALVLLQNGQPVSGIQFTLWLAQNAACTPLLIEANLPFGSLRGELTAPPQR
jgi:hypothetical protein